nr:hypothetical protein [uncultured Flavobacterium sp.]
MINKIILGICLFSLSGVYAQQGTASPYSYFGTGDQKFKGTNEVKTMGSLAVYQDSIHLNTLNPASYANLQKTTLALGFSATSANVKTSIASDKTKRSAFDYFALAFPVGDKVGVSVGIMPSTFVGYNIVSPGQEGNQKTSSEYNGEGGISRTYIGVGYKITPNLNIGAEMAYNFGDTHNSTTKFITDNGTGLFIDRGSKQMISNDYKGFSYNTALSYSKVYSNHMKLDVAVTYSPETTLKHTQTGSLSTVAFSSTGNLQTIDKIDLETSKKNLVLPQKYSLGIGYGKNHKWFIGAEYTGIQNSKYNNTFGTSQNATFEDTHRFSLGGFYTPKYNGFTNYFDRLTYRAGLRHENTGLVINNESINDTSVSVGFGFPIGINRDSSNINLGLEYGKRGTKNSGLIQENYFNISIGFSFNDKWFQKRRYE